MKIWLSVFCLVFAFQSFAVDNLVEKESNSVRTQLCDYWRYDFDINSNTCNFVGRYVELVEAREYQRTIYELERRIQKLEVLVNELNRRDSAL